MLTDPVHVSHTRSVRKHANGLMIEFQFQFRAKLTHPLPVTDLTIDRSNTCTILKRRIGTNFLWMGDAILQGYPSIHEQFVHISIFCTLHSWEEVDSKACRIQLYESCFKWIRNFEEWGATKKFIFSPSVCPHRPNNLIVSTKNINLAVCNFVNYYP